MFVLVTTHGKKKHIPNLSDYSLSDTENSVLSNGLDFYLVTSLDLIEIRFFFFKNCIDKKPANFSASHSMLLCLTSLLRHYLYQQAYEVSS